MYDEDAMEPDLVELEDDQGNVTTMAVLRYFRYNGEEYVILEDYLPDVAPEDLPEEGIGCVVMRVVPDPDDPDMETFEPIEDETLETRLMAVATTRLQEDEEADDEEE